MTSAFPLLLVAAAFVVILAGRDLSARMSETEAHTVELTTAALRLEKALGYGGFIHNFKNYVLRSKEPGYRERAEASIATALDQIDTIEDLAASIGSDYDLSAARRVLLTYGAQLDTVASMSAAGAAPLDIDAAVRVDDTEALEALFRVVGRIDDRYRARREALEADLDRLGGLFIALALMVYAALGCQLFRAIYLRPISDIPPRTDRD